ncbi:MgtC/SapB family protein [Cohnella hongkongensis]|uniref:MgtC/SapB family protein n=1 Tax=Cohnella hongkongensis TaxID=178337 RepID=A0ABV9FAJ7_9BACL
MSVIETDIWTISYVDLSLRIVASLVLGGLIGLEREWHNHAAGLRTHILVCVGSTAIMLLSIYGFGEFAHEYNVRMDPARLAAQVVSGIGFLGAGAIIRTGVNITGLTTAASIWVVAAIGLCVGAGFFYGAGLVTVFVLISLFLLNKLEKRMHDSRAKNEVRIRIVNRPGSVGGIADLFEASGLTIVHLSLETETGDKLEDSVRILRIKLLKPRTRQLIDLYDSLLASEHVLSFDSAEALKDRRFYEGGGASTTL